MPSAAWLLVCPLLALKTHGKRAPAEASATFATCYEVALVAAAFFLCAFVSAGIPHAASLVATSFVGCLRHISGKGRAREGECQDQPKRRNERLHDRYSL